MDIISLEFEKPLMINIGDTTVKILAFKTAEHGNIIERKFFMQLSKKSF